VDLSGKVVVVPVGWAGGEELAVAMAAGGATVVLVDADGDMLGRLAASLPGGRAAVFVSDGSAAAAEALAGFVSELLRS
jgi:NADPH-dependent 2,4-dienoyl-CoA reductase/sulfur reductase-like enzyme